MKNNKAEYDKDGIPIINAEISDKLHIRFYCDHCKRFHYHGRGNGHRVAHCHDPKGPYAGTGYILREVKETSNQ